MPPPKPLDAKKALRWRTLSHWTGYLIGLPASCMRFCTRLAVARRPRRLAAGILFWNKTCRSRITSRILVCTSNMSGCPHLGLEMKDLPAVIFAADNNGRHFAAAGKVQEHP